MKLIIDIPKEVKQTFDNAKNEDLYGNYYDRNSLIGKAIQNGIPLDDLRAELHETAEMHDDGDYYLRDEWIDEYFDEYMAKAEPQERSDKE